MQVRNELVLIVTLYSSLVKAVVNAPRLCKLRKERNAYFLFVELCQRFGTAPYFELSSLLLSALYCPLYTIAPIFTDPSWLNVRPHNSKRVE
jgi:hypothetical protein